MKAALLAHFFPPEPCAAATRVQSLAQALAQSGHDVTVVTAFPSFPAGRLQRSDRRKLMERSAANGYRIVRLFSALLPVPGRRLIHWLSSSAACAAYLVCTREHYDVVIASMPPITLALPALAAAWRHRAKLVVDVRDVFPDIAIAMGEWKPGSAPARLSEYVMRRVYRRADLIVAVTPTALEQIAGRGIERCRLELARNAAQESPAVERPSKNGAPFTAIYAGNLGLATDVDLLLDAASQLKDAGIRVEIAGGGALANQVRERVQRDGLANVRLSGVLTRSEALRHIAAADVAIVPLRAGITESVPTKLYDALAVGCPVIVAAGGEAASEGAALGAICTPAGDAHALSAAILALTRLEPDELRELGRRGQAAVQQRSGRAAIMNRLSVRIGAL